jgi:alpha-beta hydrolase superfamily lysophospholipase
VIVMKILFLHGWGATPGGLKPTFLRNNGYEVLNPYLPDDDFDAAVRIAQAHFDQHHPEVVVGSSRGGAVAMNIETGSTPLVLLCPAWRMWGTATTIKPNTVILHAEADEAVPIADSRQLLNNSGLPASTLVVVGIEHRLIDPDSFEAIRMAIEQVIRGYREPK